MPNLEDYPLSKIRLYAGIAGVAIALILAVTSIITLLALIAGGIGAYCIMPTLNDKLLKKFKPKTKQDKIDELQKKIDKLRGDHKE